jgi:hypothetical protein
MPVDFACPCGKQLRMPNAAAGSLGKCPSCGRVLEIPGRAEDAAEPAALPARGTAESLTTAPGVPPAVPAPDAVVAEAPPDQRPEGGDWGPISPTSTGRRTGYSRRDRSASSLFSWGRAGPSSCSPPISTASAGARRAG